MTSVIATGVLAALVGVALSAWLRQVRLRRLAARRTVERPNSHYAPPAVERRAETERWGEKIRAEDLHPINRDELNRLLAKIAASGSGSLSAGDRQFLDNLLKTHPK